MMLMSYFKLKLVGHKKEKSPDLDQEIADERISESDQKALNADFLTLF